jgi:hypothetical protein
VSGVLALADPRDGSTAFANAAELRGTLVVMWRGGCSFVEKVRRAQAAGAAAACVVQTAGQKWPFTMSDTAGAGGDLVLHSLMVSAADGARPALQFIPNASAPAPPEPGSAAAALISSIDVAWKRNQHQLRSVRAARSSLGGSADSGVADGRSAARASKASPAAAASSSARDCSGGDADGADGADDGLMSDGDSDGGSGGGGADGHWNEERDDEYAMGGF